MKISLDQLKPNEWNPNEMTPEEYQELIAEIKHLNRPSKPIVLRKRGDIFQIVDGEHTYKALKELGFSDLSEGWFEIIDVDDAEAMRQTYKRNQHGTHNPIRLGLMFERALRETGKSNRELGIEWNLSEGSVRNYLMYANAAGLRNDYANLVKLSVEQVRIYTKLAGYAKPIADYWLYSGAIPDALNVYNDQSYEWYYQNQGMRPEEDNTWFKDILEEGYADLITKRIHDKNVVFFPTNSNHRNELIKSFKESIKSVHNLIRIKKKISHSFTWGFNDEDIDGRRLAKEYVDFFFSHPLMKNTRTPKSFAPSLFAQVITKGNDGKLQFLLSMEELHECLNQDKVKTYDEIISYVRLLIAKKLNKAPSEVKDASTTEPIEDQLDALEIEKNAPEYIKQLRLPTQPKFILFKTNADDEVKKLLGMKLEMMYRGGSFSYRDGKENIQKIIAEQLHIISGKKQEADEEKKLLESTPEQLADTIVEHIKSVWKTTTEEDIADFKNRLSKNFNSPELYIFSLLARKYYDEQEFKKRMMKLHEDITKIRTGVKYD